MRAFLVFNAGSGHAERARAVGELEAALRARGMEVEVAAVKRGRDVPAAARRAASLVAAQGGVLVGAGGDGTLNAVAQAAWDADATFAALPLGTFNYFARENRLPVEPAAVAAMLAAGHVRPVQVGLVNGRLFLVNASLGFYPVLLEDREAFKQQYGRMRWVALLAALWSLLFRTKPHLVLRIATGGEARTVRVSTLFVGNNPLQLERLGIREAQAVEEGCLAAIRVRPPSPWRLLDILLHGAVGRLGVADGVEAFAFRDLEVGPLRPHRRPVRIKVAADGESATMALPLVFRVAPRPLRLVVPTPVPAPVR